jgi:Fibronectin type III domain
MGAGATSFPFTGLAAGRWYSFRVRAIIGGKKGPYSATTGALYVLKAGETAAPVTVPNALSAPSSLSVTLNDRSVALSWTPPRLGSGQKVANYVVTAIPGPIVLNVSSSSSSAGFGDLVSGTAYNFTVQAVFTDGRRSPVISSAPILVGPTTTTAQPTTTPATTTTITLPPTTTTLPPTTTTLQPLPSVPAIAAIPVSKCISSVWPASMLGRPSNFGAGAKRGAYVWFENGVWNVHLYNPASSPSLFTGSVTTGSTQKIYPTYTEGATDLVKAGSKVSTFSFSTANDIDAVRVASPCSRSTTFSFLVNGQAMLTEDIYVGASGAHPLSSRFVITR